MQIFIPAVLFVIATVIAALFVLHIQVKSRNTHHPNQYDDIDWDSYFDGFNKTDYLVRGCNSKHECIKLYLKELRMPTEKEKTILNKQCSRIDAQLVKTFPLLASVPWRFLIFETHRVENGFPHTHGNTIILPARIINSSTSTSSTLLHEKVHVFQRLYPHLTTMLILDFWKFQLFGPRHNHTNLRRNPDINEIIYSKHSHPILPKYVPNATTLTDISNPDDHPYEIMAYTIQEMYTPSKNNRYAYLYQSTQRWIDLIN